MQPFRFKLQTPENSTILQEATVLPPCWDSFVWIERYSAPGEWSLKGDVSDGWMEMLPIGSFISHIETHEVGMVEDHKIEYRKGSDPKVTISGRMFEAALEFKTIGCADGWGSGNERERSKYILNADYVGAQLVTLINDHIKEGTVENTHDAWLGGWSASTFTLSGPVKRRSVDITTLDKVVQDLLTRRNYGIRSYRPNNIPLMGGSVTDGLLWIHAGENKVNDVLFSEAAGDIDGGDFLWSNRDERTAAHVLGKWMEVRWTLGSPYLKFARKYALVPAEEVDEKEDQYPDWDPTHTEYEEEMDERGEDAINKRRYRIMQRIDISPESQYRFRRDYDIGDKVRVDGGYGVEETMRVIENTEVHDAHGYVSFPTLAAPWATT